MNRLFPSLFLCIATSLAQANELPALEKGQSLEVKLVAYYEGESDQTRYGRKNAIGTVLRADPDYTSAAADWSIFPLGTRFRIEGGETIYQVDDYGSGLIGRITFDLYVTSNAEMKRFNSRTAEIEIVEVGSFQKSAKILAGRVQHRHCRTMYTAIQERMGE